jgi:hypothetical protein
MQRIALSAAGTPPRRTAPAHAAHSVDEVGAERRGGSARQRPASGPRSGRGRGERGGSERAKKPKQKKHSKDSKAKGGNGEGDVGKSKSPKKKARSRSSSSGRSVTLDSAIWYSEHATFRAQCMLTHAEPAHQTSHTRTGPATRLWMANSGVEEEERLVHKTSVVRLSVAIKMPSRVASSVVESAWIRTAPGLGARARLQQAGGLKRAAGECRRGTALGSGGALPWGWANSGD